MRIFILVACVFFPLAIAFAEPQFLVITDIHYGANNETKDGSDSGPALLKLALERFTDLSKNVDFILNLGDLPTHLIFFTSKKIEYERTVFHKLFQADLYKKPMFYIPGNNDSLGGNYQPFVVDGKSPLMAAKDWNSACVYCEDLLIDKTHINSGGYYSSYVIPKNKNIMLIALNSAPFVNVPQFARSYPNQDADANEELAWLAQQLKTHRAKQLLIAMHVPPGLSYKGDALWNKKPLHRFMALLEHNQASYQQITLFTAHTHMDGIRKLVLSNNRAIYAFSTPGISLLHHNNPAIKLFNLNRDWAVSNYTTYYSSSLNTWRNEHYQAVAAPDAIFPNCHTNTLVQCLDSLNTKEVCTRMERGLFEGARSPRVKNQWCEGTYLIK